MGTRFILDSIITGNGDHPHACGDKYEIACYFLLISGSSPRVWGQADFVLLYTDVAGIIPTRVGTSVSILKYSERKKDHPHACGDKYSYKSKAGQAQGSSPRVWGQVTPPFFVIITQRIIPTRVGTSGFGKKSKAQAEDHPHACGDKSAQTPQR